MKDVNVRDNSRIISNIGSCAQKPPNWIFDYLSVLSLSAGVVVLSTPGARFVAAVVSNSSFFARSLESS